VAKKLHLHFDADTSQKAIYRVLIEMGHDVTRTPNDWMPFDATDEQQLLGATEQGRAIFTYNVPDFVELAKKYPNHAGIILAKQKNLSIGETITALDNLLREAEADVWQGQIRWLNDWR
jgi:hypothetical protein